LFTVNGIWPKKEVPVPLLLSETDQQKMAGRMG
jgi:hypothetical protein